MSDPLSALPDQALLTTLRRVYARNITWAAAIGGTKIGKMQRLAEERGFIVLAHHPRNLFLLTDKGREFINAG